MNTETEAPAPRPRRLACHRHGAIPLGNEQCRCGQRGIDIEDPVDRANLTFTRQFHVVFRRAVIVLIAVVTMTTFYRVSGSELALWLGLVVGAVGGVALVRRLTSPAELQLDRALGLVERR